MGAASCNGVWIYHFIKCCIFSFLFSRCVFKKTESETPEFQPRNLLVSRDASSVEVQHFLFTW